MAELRFCLCATSCPAGTGKKSVQTMFVRYDMHKMLCPVPLAQRRRVSRQCFSHPLRHALNATPCPAGTRKKSVQTIFHPLRRARLL
ncbi:15330_t:CDS:2 [Funneliformis mosseae]|uniref:15330_t:CDS:1 n=1 Tax=Funneliformis mosseae TaxID=27381 RepID=A0A9N9HHJ6_FUNMO|nr:15330_t:CDS:2 [Funneliformis mosseae]